MRDPSDQGVVAWIDAQPGEDLFVTAISEAEIRAGVTALPAGRRQRELAAAAERVLSEFFLGRILVFDSQAAQQYAAVVAERRAAGRPISLSDALIAAIVRSMGASIVTRDVRGFDGLGLEIVNPWADA